MADRVTIGAGDWSDAAKWDGGVAIPASGETVQISHAITKDSAAGANDCAGLEIDTGITLTMGGSGGLKVGGAGTITGTLAIGTRAIEFTGAVTVANGGTVTGGASGSFTVGANSIMSAGATMTLTGTAGNLFQLIGTTVLQWTFNGGVSSPASSFQFDFVNFEDWSRLFFNNVSPAEHVRDCAFLDVTTCIWGNSAGTGELLEVTRTSFDDATYAWRGGAGSGAIYRECTFGETTAVTTLAIGPDSGAQLEYFNCSFGGITNYVLPWSSKAGWRMRHQGCDGEGEWSIFTQGGRVLRSTASKKTGDFGIEMIPHTYISQASLYVDIPIPVESSDDMSGVSIYYTNLTADLGLEDVANRLLFELDPGDEWGLNEVQDADDYGNAYHATVKTWVQISFTGGTAGGTAKKGSLILRVWLKRYVASAVVYLADPVY